MRKKFFLLLISSFFLFNLSAWPSFCEVRNSTKDFVELKKKVEEKIKIFSNHKDVAIEADAVLSKLISAKSPFLSNWYKKRNLDSKSEVEIAREWRLYYAKNFIFSTYPQEKEKINDEIEKLAESVNKLFATSKFKNKMEKLFLHSKSASVQKIKGFPINEEQKNKILARIEKIKLYWMKDFKSSKFKQQPLDFLDWGIAYDPLANEINMGINALEYSSEETLKAVFAHEIGHSFDSCRWGAFFDGEWPFKKIGECLRAPGSVAAKIRDDSQMESLIKSGKLSSDLAAGLKQNPTCNKQNYPPFGVQADQLPETFADWFATEVMAGEPHDFNSKKLRTDLCEVKELNPGSSYPNNQLRLENIYFAHPKFRLIRDDLKDKSVKYCSWN